MNENPPVFINTNDSKTPIESESSESIEKLGISISNVAVSESQLVEQGYEKLPHTTLAHLNELIRYVPSVAVEQTTRTAANENTTQMLTDAVKIIRKDGLHMGRSHDTPGRYRGMLFSDEGNRLKSFAEFEEIDRIELTKTPQRVLLAFDLLSAITGQYYMANINKQLSNIEKSVQNVLDFLSNDKQSRIYANQEFLADYSARIDSIRANSIERAAVLTQVDLIKRDARSDIEFFNKQLRHSLSASSAKKSAINRLVSDICSYIPQYWCSVELYAKASLLHVLLVESSSPDDLNAIWNDLSSKKTDYRNSYDESIDRLGRILQKKRAIEKLAVMPFSVLSAFALILPDGGLTKALLEIPSAVQTNIEEKRENRINDKLRFCLADCADLSALELTMNSVERYNMIQNNGFEIIKTQNAAYIKFFKDEKPDTNVDPHKDEHNTEEI